MELTSKRNNDVKYRGYVQTTAHPPWTSGRGAAAAARISKHPKEILLDALRVAYYLKHSLQGHSSTAGLLEVDINDRLGIVLPAISQLTDKATNFADYTGFTDGGDGDDVGAIVSPVDPEDREFLWRRWLYESCFCWLRNRLKVVKVSNQTLGSSQRPHPGNRHDQRAKPGEGLRCCVCLHTRTATTTAFAFTITTTISDEESLLSCPQCDRTFTSRISLVGYMQIHRTETSEPVPGAPTDSRDRHLHCPHCPFTFTDCMGLFGHMRTHDCGIHNNADNNDTPCTHSAPAILSATTMNDVPRASTDFSCPHCARN
ncbi:unnamed protein product [Schistocephalus solidus]|uniref:C2H2-type domain-containing protein n=1 Tax=Schistocephalus solidus TaxID=70667 RepID=A0A183SKX6_SCHSO|nr:unnamed protein product [Schistocephalus solidus]